MTDIDYAELAYEQWKQRAPEVDNPHRSEGVRQKEQMVGHSCGSLFRVMVDEKKTDEGFSTLDYVMPGVMCPHCGGPAADYRTISSHSGGVFNATHIRPPQ